MLKLFYKVERCSSLTNFILSPEIISTTPQPLTSSLLLPESTSLAVFSSLIYTSSAVVTPTPTITQSKYY